MNDAVKTAATTAMKGGGYYSQSTRGAKDVIDNATDMLLEAVAALPAPTQGRALRIGDFGAADGGTSKRAIREVVAALRTRFPGAQIEVTYTDLASNDWSQLFKAMQGLDGSEDTYWSEFDGVFVTGCGIGFHRQLIPSGGLDLGFSATAMHYVSERPCQIHGHVHHVGATGEALAAFDAQAAADWERILLARAAELRPGGRLVVMSFGKDEEGRYLGNTDGVNMFDTFQMLWLRLYQAGVISDVEYDAATFAQVYRTPEEFAAPLRDTASSVYAAGLRIVSIHTGVTPCPYRTAFLSDPDMDARAFARSYIPTLRSWSETVFLNALDEGRPANERAEIVDDFYQSYQDLVADNPDGHAMDYVHSYIAVEKVA
ncbi:MAG: SAM-dependent methyltransferase [Pseudomonadota bacterium]